MREASRSFMPYPFREVKHANHGPLNGLTFAVKDLFDVAGYPTGGGNPHILALSGVKKHRTCRSATAGCRCPFCRENTYQRTGLFDEWP